MKKSSPINKTITMNSISKFILSLLASILILNCSKEKEQNNLSDFDAFKIKLEQFEENLTNINARSTTHTFESVQTPENEYDYYGLEYSEFLLNLKTFIIDNDAIGNEITSELVQNYINSNISNISIDQSDVDVFEELLLNSFSNHTELDHVIEFSKYYEEFVIENFINPSQREYLLSTIAAYKWIGFNLFYENSENKVSEDFKSLTENRVAIACSRRTGIEYCMCKRIESREADWNWVDTVGFLISGAQQLAWDLAACTAAAVQQEFTQAGD